MDETIIFQAFRWLFVGLAGLMVLFLVLTFFTALIEKQRLSPLAPTDPAREESFSPRSRQIIESARLAGFEHLGVFSDGDKGWMAGFIVLMRSSDHHTLLWIQKFPKRCKLITALPGDRTLVTSDVKGLPDLSGLQDEDMLPEASFEVLLSYHNQRIATSGQQPIPFLGDAPVDDLFKLEQTRVERAVLLGRARYRSLNRDRWSCTLGGAFRATFAFFATMRNMKRQIRNRDLQASLLRRPPVDTIARNRRREL